MSNKQGVVDQSVNGGGDRHYVVGEDLMPLAKGLIGGIKLRTLLDKLEGIPV
jgi:hypothetical protein